MAKALKVVINNQAFECYTTSQGCHMVGVSIWEVTHPTRKFFRGKWRDTRYFFLDDYESIAEGVYAKVQEYLQDCAEENARIDKWKEFEKELKNS